MFNMSIGIGGLCVPAEDPKWRIQEEIYNYVCESLDIKDQEKKQAVYDSVYKWIGPKQYTPKLSVYQIINSLIDLGFKVVILTGLVLGIYTYLI